MPQSGRARQKRLKACDPFNTKAKPIQHDPTIDLRRDAEGRDRLNWKGRQMQRSIENSGGIPLVPSFDQNQSKGKEKSSSHQQKEGASSGNKRKNKFISEDGTRPVDKFKLNSSNPQENDQPKPKKQKKEEVREVKEEKREEKVVERKREEKRESNESWEKNNNPDFTSLEMSSRQISKMTPRDGESMDKFQRRLNAAMWKKLEEVKIEEKALLHSVDTREGPTNRQLKNKAYFERKKKKMLKKKYPGIQFSDSEEEEEGDEPKPEDKHKGKMKSFKQQSDPVAFGEFAEAPPILKSLPKKKKKVNDEEESILPLSNFRGKKKKANDEEKDDENELEVKKKTKALKDGQFKWKTMDEGERKEKKEEKAKAKKEREMDERVLMEKRNMEAIRMKMYKAYKEAKARKIEQPGPSFNVAPIG